MGYRSRVRACRTFKTSAETFDPSPQVLVSAHDTLNCGDASACGYRSNGCVVETFDPSLKDRTVPT